MKKFFALLLILAALPLIAHADADLAAMSVDELRQLRDAANIELANRCPIEGPLASWTLPECRIDLLRIDLGTDRDGNPAFSPVFAFTNLGTETNSMLHYAYIYVYHGGVECEWAFVNDSSSSLQMKKVQPGGTFDGVVCGYSFNGDSKTIDVEITMGGYPYTSFGTITVPLP